LKNILIVATHPQRFLDQLHFAKELNSKSNENIQIYFFIAENVFSLYKDEIDKLSFKIINNLNYKEQIEINSLTNQLRIKLNKILSLTQIKQVRKFIDFLKTTKIYSKRLLSQEKLYLDNLELHYDIILKLVKINNINVFLINGDRHLGYEPVFLKISKVLNISSIIPYFVDFSDEERILKNKGKNNYYYAHPIGNALQNFGVLSSDPYVMGCGESDILCLNSKQNVEKYIQKGVDKDKIYLVGDISFDRLYNNYIKREALKKEIKKKYSLNKGAEIVIIALPQLAEHRLMSWDDHWKEIHFLMKELSSINKNILISLHPKMDKLKYEFLESDYNCKILDERLGIVLPIADLFVATFSSTVVWSVLCEIKTIVVDFYDLNYSMYDFLTSIEIVNNRDEFKDILMNIFYKKKDFKEDWDLLSKDTVFNGNVINLYIDLIGKV